MISKKARSITIDKKLDKKLVKEAKKTNRKISNLICLIVQEYFDAKKKSKKSKNK